MKRKKSNSSIKDIAKAAGVSTATVSRVFSRHPYVTEDTRKNILRIAREIGYAPRISSSRYIFGIMVGMDGGISYDAYSIQLLHYTTKHIFELGFNAQVFGPKQLAYLHKNTFRGVILFNSEYAKRIQKIGIPVLLVNVFADGVHSVVTDHREGLELAVEHLYKKGHRRIAFLRMGNDNWGSVQREEGYRNALLKYKLEINEKLLSCYRNKNNIPDALRKLLKQSPDALIVEGEDNGVIVNYLLYEAGIKIPDDLSLITFEDSDHSCYMTPPQTTLSQDLEELGRVAAETMVDLANPRKRKTVPPVKMLPCNKIIERCSVAQIKHDK